MLEIVRDIASRSPPASVSSEEVVPGPAVQSTQDVLTHSWASGGMFHTVAIARMGAEWEGVVAPDLTVHGVTGLRVADASVLPYLPGLTMAPSILVGAMAARLITDTVR